jgi:phosphoribosylformylglycinamidine (FGAM) synthase-like amidotransferase family enzyme
MAVVRALVLSGNGINCERETAFACQAASADHVEIVPIWNLLAGEKHIRDYNLLCLPGGFMDGDDVGSARAAANYFRYARIAGSNRRLWDDLRDFIAAGNLVFGICNGFQLLVKLGVLPGLDPRSADQSVTLTNNDSGRFEDRWVELAVDKQSACIFTRGLSNLPVPVRHGEGKLVASSEVLTTLSARHLIPLRYADPVTGNTTMQYPANPNGSPDGIAALCSLSGRVFGMMPHPECFTHRTHHPRWTRLPKLPEEGLGLRLFRNAVEFLRKNMQV